MRVLAIDSSAVSAGAAVVEDGKILGRFFVNTGYTHSQTLLPMIENVLAVTGRTVADMDLIAVSNGPGSFTGVRIGVATAKGLAFKNKIPCAGISTLEAMAYNFLNENAIVYALMDARRMQVYNAVFRVCGGVVTRLCEDRAAAVEEIGNDLAQYKEERIIFVGDGAALCYNILKDACPGIVLAAENIRYQDAYGVAMAALQAKAVSAEDLTPSYLRLAQAQRELKLKLEKKEEKKNDSVGI